MTWRKRRIERCAVLATMPGRESMLEQVVGAILPQVDRLLVRLNGHETVPRALMDPRIEVSSGPNRGVRERFSLAANVRGYVVSIDDDIAYPVDYLERLVRGLETYAGPVVVGLHASTFGEVADFLDASRIIPYWSQSERDFTCHALGSGTIAWDSTRCRIRASDFPFPNGIDAQLAALGQRRGWPFVALSRPAGWVTSLWPPDAGGARRAGATSVWRHTTEDRASDLNARPSHRWAVEQVDRWVLHPARRRARERGGR